VSVHVCVHTHVHKGLRQALNINYMYIKSDNSYKTSDSHTTTRTHTCNYISDWVAMDYMGHEYSTAVAVLD